MAERLEGTGTQKQPSPNPSLYKGGEPHDPEIV